MHVPRRVLITGDTVGGVWTFACDLARGLVEQGMEVCLATLGRKASATQREEIASIPGLEWFDGGYKVEWMDDPWKDVELSRRWLAEIACAFRPELVHFNTFGHGTLCSDVPTVLSLHSCVPSWWAAVRGGNLPDEWSTYRACVELALLSATVVVAPTRAILAEIATHYEADLSSARVVYNGRHSADFRCADKQPFIFSAGRLWDDAKNIAALTRVAPSLPWPVHFAGDTCERGVADTGNCVFLGQLTPIEMANTFASASIYALPAKYEPFGLSILEAALSGCALVLGDIPTLRELWQDCAVFVPPGDSEALRCELERLIHDPCLLSKVASAARRRALEFPPSRTISAYRDAYRTACAVFARRSLACVS